jgi:hypothetical protein
MGVVSLNLGERDATYVQRALAGVIAGCACWQSGIDEPCEGCQSLGAVVAALNRCLTRPPDQRPSRLACGQLGAHHRAETMRVSIDPTMVSTLLSGQEHPELAN